MEGALLDPSGITIVCPQCGQKNRLKFDSLDRTPRCGKCHSELPRPGTPIEVPSSETFSALVERSALPVLVDFWAEWCGPCRMVAPELVEVAASHAGQLVVAKVDTDALSDVSMRYRIVSIPTLALLHRGRELARLSGARPAAAITAFIDQTLSSVTR